jgi:hypothetical protein
MYRYRAYELIINSEFPIPEFIPDQDLSSDCDITIHYGDVPENLEQVLGQGVLYQTSANQFLPFLFLTFPHISEPEWLNLPKKLHRPTFDKPDALPKQSEPRWEWWCELS